MLTEVQKSLNIEISTSPSSKECEPMTKLSSKKEDDKVKYEHFESACESLKTELKKLIKHHEKAKEEGNNCSAPLLGILYLYNVNTYIPKLFLVFKNIFCRYTFREPR